MALALHDYDELASERDSVAQELAELNAETGKLSAATERMEAELSGMETAVIEADQKIAKLESEDIRISSQLQAAEDAVRMNEQRLSELDDLEEATKAEIAKTEAALDMMRDELGRGRTESETLEATIAAGQAQLAERRAAIHEIENMLRSFRSQVEDKRAQAVDLASEGAKFNNELSAIAAQRDQLVRQDRRLADHAVERRKNLAECSEQRTRLDAGTEDIARTISARQEDRETTGRELEEAERQHGELLRRMEAKRSRLAGASSRRELLGDLEQKLEGVSMGARHLMEAAAGDNPALSGICGVIADVIEVNIEHAPAIEAALGAHEQLVVTESFGAMTDAIDFLARSGKGQASFLPLDAADGHAAEPGERPATPGVVGRAIDFVRHPERFSQPLRRLLGDVLVVRDIETAKQLAASNGHGLRYATLDGQLLSPHGVSVGGARNSVPGVISRRSELRALEAEQAALEADLAALETQREEHAERSAALKQRIRQVSDEIVRAQGELADARAESGKLDAFIKRLESEIEAGDSEQAEIKSHIVVLDGRESEVREEAAGIARNESELKAAVAELERRLGESEAERDQKKRQATELEVAEAQHVERAGNLRRRIDELGRLIAERAKSCEVAREQVGACVRRRGEAALVVSQKKSEIDDLLERRGRLGLEKAGASNERELIRAQFDSKRNERSEAGRRSKEAEAKVNKLNVHAAEVAMKIENLERRGESEYDCSLAERLGQGPGEELDWQLVAQEIETINQKMKSMGAVNTYAIEELEELERRSSELTGQRDDLQKADHTLKEIIRKINRHSRDMFRKTFDDVRENFQELFRKLFGGGRADIVLEEDVDILDAGIDIIACPPGKEPASISLLSGGEKAMTAVALLFAVFRSRPSPFCILDEVDAALDESNIERFCMLVRDFLRDSQFLVVTHSRRTMSMADALYGITMQEPGVSTHVAVKFDDEEEVAAAG